MTKKDLRYILENKTKADKNFAEALKEAGASTSEIEGYLSRLPNFRKLSLQDGENVYRSMRNEYILTLREIFGLTYREISRRIGGESYQAARRVVSLDNDKKNKIQN